MAISSEQEIRHIYQIGFRISTDDLGRGGAAIGKGDFDLVRRLHYVMIGQDIAFAADDDPRAQTGLALRFRIRAVAEEMAENWIIHQGVARDGDRLAGENIDHRWHGLLYRTVERGKLLRPSVGGDFLDQHAAVAYAAPGQQFGAQQRNDKQNAESDSCALREDKPKSTHGRTLMILRELERYIGQLLEISSFHDYCPNGVQVEGRAEVTKIVSGVSASLDVLEAASAAGADAVLVHHGYFWKNEDARITGTKRARIAHLIEHGMSLLAYHLPLDAHPVLGNNAQLAQLLDFQLEERFGEQNIAAAGRLIQPMSLQRLSGVIEEKLQRQPLVIGDDAAIIRRIAWCSGAAQDYLGAAIDLGVDAFLTGEVSEHTVHLARESGVAFISAGHHATERYGVQALGAHLAQQLGVKHQFIDIENPV